MLHHLAIVCSLSREPQYSFPHICHHQDWARSQRSFQFYQSSVLLMYDGAAPDISQAGVRVALVDFAHTFRTLAGAHDDNLLKALGSLIGIVEGVVEAALGGAALDN